MAEQTEQSIFFSIAINSSQNFNALRVLVSHIGSLADEYDKGTFSSFNAGLSELFPSLMESVKTKAAEQSTEGDSSNHKFDEKTEREIDEAFKSEEGRAKFTSLLKDLTIKHPMQGSLIRRGALTTLFTHFEGALAKIIHVYYEKYPAALPAEDRTLTLADLRQVGSVANAEKLIVEKEVDSVLRQNSQEQIAYFRKRLKINIEPLESLMPAIVEISQRRNIYVHNNGTVNRQYLLSVDESLARQYKAQEGEQLHLSTEYLLNAIDGIDAATAMLMQACWRKWDQASEADRHLIILTYDGLRDQRYEYVKLLATFSKQADAITDLTRRIVLINHAIALRETGDSDGIENILHEMDWSAAPLRFKIALHALRDEQKEFLKVLPKAIAAEEIELGELKDWPLFKPWRGKDWFNQKVAELATPTS